VKLPTIVFIIIATLSLTISAAAQSHRASIRGTVTDPNGAVIPNVKVQLANSMTNQSRTTVSNPNGDYTFSSLVAGAYNIEFKVSGFATFRREVLLEVNQQLRLDASLEIETTVHPYYVTVPQSDLKKDSPGLGTTINNKNVSGLPLDGRNFYELTLLVPGAVPAAQGSAGSVRGDFAFSVNGAREDSNNFLLDGVYNVDPKLNTFGVRPPVDAIQEFETQTSGYDAAFGRNPGAQVNVVLKSGGNQFHGSVYEFFRNARLDARNFFARTSEPKPRYQRNQFGFAFGGPIVKDKTFFFTDYEGTRSREGITRVTNVPTAAERNGDFSQSLFARPFNPFTQQPFPGGVIPAQFQHPVGRAIAALYPLPNRNAPFANYVSSPILRDDNDHFDLRVDHYFSQTSQFTARYSFGDRRYFEPFTGPTFSAVPGYGAAVPRRSQNLLLGETHVFTPNLVNEARFAFNRVASAVTQENAGTSVNRQVGLPELAGNPRDFGLSFISVTGFSPLGHEGNNPQASATNTFQFLDTATYTRGAHLFKFGADFRFTQQNAFRDVQSRGFLNFSSFLQLTNNALADLLLGFPIATGRARVDNAQHLRARSYNFFANDSWRVTPRFTLNAGLRYELNTPPFDAFNRVNLYDPTRRTLVQPGSNGFPRGGANTDRNNFAPRLGFAWTLDKAQKTVLRAGYGLYYDQSPLAPGEALYFNVPFFDINIFFPLQNSLLTLSDPFPANFPVPLPDSALALQRDLRTPYMQHWNLNIQRELGRSRVLEAAYVGSKGAKLLASRDINQPPPGVYQNPFFLPRPNPVFADITLIESRANSNYHSLQTRFQQRFDDGLSVLASYVWSKSIDDASGFFNSAGDPNFPQDSFNVAAERGLSNFDTRHRLSVSYAYELPIFKGRKYLGGWQTFGVVAWQSGRPFTVALLPDIDNSGTGRASLGFGNNDRPNVNGNPDGNRTPERWFNTSAFSFPTPGRFGNAGRNILTGPRFANVNFSLVKDTALSETFKLQLRAEAFNLFNHTNLNLPDHFLGSPTFGQITSANAPRRLQFGVKLLF
jgi:hypothetical protein